jgi:hypothetical protein
MLELRPLLLDLRQFGLSLLKLAMLAAPREDSVRPRNCVPGESSDDNHRQGRHRHPADQRENAVRSPHDVQESRASHERK